MSVCRIIREEAATIGKLSGLPGSSNVIPWGIFPFIVLPGRKKSVQIISGCIASSSEMTLFPGVGSGFFPIFYLGRTVLRNTKAVIFLFLMVAHVLFRVVRLLFPCSDMYFSFLNTLLFFLRVMNEPSFYTFFLSSLYIN